MGRHLREMLINNYTSELHCCAALAPLAYLIDMSGSLRSVRSTPFITFAELISAFFRGSAEQLAAFRFPGNSFFDGTLPPNPPCFRFIVRRRGGMMDGFSPHAGRIAGAAGTGWPSPSACSPGQHSSLTRGNGSW